jgi:hypothetical protein
MLSWNPGDPIDDNTPGPFKDPSQDLVDLALTLLGGTNYQVCVTRVVGAFSNPIDAAIISNRVYVIEYGGSQGIWEITFPAAAAAPSRIAITDTGWINGHFAFSFNTTVGKTYQIQTSTNLLDWSSLGGLLATNTSSRFVDANATNFPQRFYRVTLP